MTDPDIATVLRQMKIPERMTSSQALRDFLLANTEDGRNVPSLTPLGLWKSDSRWSITRSSSKS